MTLKPFFVWQNKVLKRVDPMQVMLLVTKQNLTKICLADETAFDVRTSLTGALKKLPPGIFIQINKYLAASVYYIDDIARDHLVIKEKVIPIGRAFIKPALAKLNIIGELKKKGKV